jgi:hypothetical protein
VRERVECQALETIHLIAEPAQRLQFQVVNEPFRREPRSGAFDHAADLNGIERLCGCVAADR